MRRRQRENLLLLHSFVGLLGLGAAAAFTASRGSNVLAGIAFIVIGTMIVIARQSVWPPVPAKMGWAGWSVLNRTNWRQWPKPWFATYSTLVGLGIVVLGLSLLIDELSV